MARIKNRRAAALILALLLAVLMLFSALFPAVEAHHHHCHEAGCPVCALLARFRGLLRLLHGGALLLCGVVCTSVVRPLLAGAVTPHRRTPVAWKIRLNN